MGENPRLTIELVPETSWYSNLRSELSQGEWNWLKRETFKNANFKCYICGGRGKKWPVECHEIWEYDDENKIQTLKGTVALCPSCHEVKHIGLADVNGRLDQAVDHLMKVNDWDIEEAGNYVVEAFRKWDERSEFEWKIDIEWIGHWIHSLKGVKYAEKKGKT